MKTLLLFLVTFAVPLNAKKMTKDTVVDNSYSKKDNYINSVNWSSYKNKELNQKDIVSKDQDLGFVNTDILIKLYEECSVEYYYSYTMRIDSKDEKYKISINNPVLRVRMSSVDLSELPVRTLMRYRNYLEVLIKLIKDEFNNKMEWDFNDMINVTKKSDIPKPQRDILTKIIAESNTINKKLFLDCIEGMKKDNKW